MIYLAGPYSAKKDDGSPDTALMAERARSLTEMAGSLMLMGHTVFSPITHGHAIDSIVPMPRDWSFWKRIDEAFIKNCNVVFVACLSGWRDSVGVADEIAFCRKIGKHVRYIAPCLTKEAVYADKYSPSPTPDLLLPADLTV